MNEVARTCGAMGRSGYPCRRRVAPGFTRCVLHGGATPLARQAASEALARAALPAAEAMFDIIDRYHREVCPTCGLPNGDPGPVIRAAQIVLDRTGFGPAGTLAVTTSAPNKDLAGLSDEELMARAEKLLAAAKKEAAERAARIAQEAEPPMVAIEGVILDPEPGE